MRKHHPKLAYALILCLAILPAVLHGWVVLRYSVNVPFADDWNLIPVLEAFARGTLSFSDLFAPINDSRFFFPKLAYIAVAHLSSFDVRYLMLISFLLACLISFNVYHLGKRTIGASPLKLLLLFFLSNLFIFAPIQATNWLWGITFSNWIPIACITSCLALLYSDLGTRTKFFTCMIISTISTFSFANGMLIWILIFPVIALSRTWGELVRKRWLILGWAVGFALNVTLYFYNFRPSSLGGPSAIFGTLVHPVQNLQTFQFFLAFLGAPYSHGLRALVSSSEPLGLATVLGAVLLLLFTLSCVYLLRSLRDFVLIRQAIPWLMIGAYSIISAILAALGRAKTFGVEGALSFRYATFSLYVVVSLIYLLTIVSSNLAREGNPLRRRPFITAFSTILVATVMFFHSLTSINWVTQTVPRFEIGRSNAKTCLLLINVVDDECVAQVFHHTEELRQRAPIADDLRFLTPSLLKSNKVRDIEGVRSGSANYGHFGALTKVAGDLYLASGWAVLPEEGKPADGVLLTYEDANGESIVFAVAATGIARREVTEKFDTNANILSGWQETFSASVLPTSSTKIGAWAFDAETGKAFKLNKAYVLGDPR